MHKLNSRRQGFTIVELLIVIVVIAILAAISIVAFTGIQNRANKTAVSSDYSNFAKKVELLAADTGSYPMGSLRVASNGSSTGIHYGAILPTIEFAITKSSYAEPLGSGAANFIYCEGQTTAGAPAWAIVARVRGHSNEALRYSSIHGIETIAYGGTGGLAPSLCTSAGIATTGARHSYSYGYFSNNGGWQSWVE